MAEIGASYIVNCHNIGKIISTGENSTDSYAGGIVGGEYTATINIINCYNFNENEEIEDIERKHEYQLKTTGIEEIYQKEILKKAN